MRIYVVGGYVRDKYMGLEPKDRDFVVVGATPEQMLVRGFKQVGADFPVFLHPVTGEEFALARKERKIGSGYHGFEVDFDPNITLEDDLFRRDFTMNAMAMELLELSEDGKTATISNQIIDPFNGMNDIQRELVVHVSDHFAEDPVRVLRAARLAARYGFEIADHTLHMIQYMCDKGELNHLTRERVWVEFEKAVEDKRGGRFLQHLALTDALQAVFPTIYEEVQNFTKMRRAINVTDETYEALALIAIFLRDISDLQQWMTIPTKDLSFAKKFVALYNRTFTGFNVKNAELVLKLFNDLDAFRDKDFLKKAMETSCCLIDDPVIDTITDLVGLQYRAMEIGFDDLPEEQKGTLSGPQIGEAINSLRLQAIKDELSS